MAEVDPRARRTVILVTVLGTFLAFLDATIVNVAFPDIERSFDDASRSGLSWVLNAYNVVFAALLVPAGRIGDVVGHRRVFFAGLLLFTLASAGCAGAFGAEALVAARVVQAAGAAMIMPAALAVLLAVYERERRAQAVAAAAAAAGVAAAIGPSLGGGLVEWSGWRVIFLINLPLGLFVWLRGRRAHPQVGGEHRGPFPELLGTALLSGAVGLVALGLVQGPEWGWDDPVVIGSFVAAIVLLPLALQRARSHPAPAIDLALLRTRGFALANAATFVFAAAFFAKILNDILFLTSVWGYSVVTAGLAMSPSPLITAATAGTAGRLAARYGHRAIIVPGALFYAAGNGWYALAIPHEPAYVTHFLPATLLTGIGIACALPMLTSAAVEAVGPANLGTASAANATARQLGGVLGIAILIAIVGTPAAAEALGQFHAGWGFIATCAALSGAVALTLRSQREAEPLGRVAVPPAASSAR